MKLINVRGHNHIRFHSGSVISFALLTVPGPGAALVTAPDYDLQQVEEEQQEGRYRVLLCT